MVQVENEVGLLGDSRDRSIAADRAFAQPVPLQLTDYLKTNWASLHPDLRANLARAEPATCCSTPGSERGWAQTFGQSAFTDEMFMAYKYALYIDRVAAAGKAAMSLPLFTNVWQNYAEGASTGESTVAADIWYRFTPSIDFIAPDIYFHDYHKTCEKYRHDNQPLFIPEQRRDGFGARWSWISIRSFAASGVSPFGIDTLEAGENEYAQHYALMASTRALILEAQLRAKFSLKQYDDYEITIEKAFVFGLPGPAAGMVIHQGGPNFLFIGWGFQVRACSLATAAMFTGIMRFEEKEVVDRGTVLLETRRT